MQEPIEGSASPILQCTGFVFAFLQNPGFPAHGHTSVNEAAGTTSGPMVSKNFVTRLYLPELLCSGFVPLKNSWARSSKYPILLES